MSEKLIFPIGFDLDGGVKEASKEWKSTYQKQLQKAIDDKPLKAKIKLETKGLDLGKLKEFNKISKEMVAASKANAKMQRDNIAVQERQRLADERVAAAHERTLASVARRKKAEEGLNRVYKTQSGYLQRLFQRMAAYASVKQAFSFIRNIRDVTAQFELQRVALGSIIGDLNEANAMFEQIKAAAVKSPFQIKELLTYTKQLAAYRIEQDELFETTQRLADISAGLGVSMDRIILAYGQIRATGYLRASEVRQLTEAGIPIVEELAKKMSELRGETVSAGAVMGMISERAISFGKVKEVFDDMTSAGGLFYKMQEKQAETLRGQWLNLRDSASIMYEEIGKTKSANNAMKGMIGLAKALLGNWRNVWSVVQSLSVAMGVYYVTMKSAALASTALSVAEATRLSTLRATTIYMPKFLASTKLAITLTRAYRVAVIKSATATGLLSKVFWGLTKAMFSNPYTAVLAALAGLATLLLTTESRAKRLNKELAKIGTEGALQADQSVRNFERLALAIRESADGSAKQTEALAEMKRAYGEFLPSQDKSIINLVREKDGYNAVTQAIREKIALQIQEQKLNTIASKYGSQFTKWEGKLKESQFFKDFSKEEISLIISDIKNAVNDGLIATTNDIEDNMNKVRDIIHNITGSFISQDNLQRLFTGGTLYKGYVTELIKTQEAYNAQIQEVESSMESATGSLGKYTQAYKDFKEELKDVMGTGKKFSFEWNESKTKAEIKAYNEFIGNLLAKEGIKFDIGEAIDFKGLYEALGDNYPQLKQVVAKIQGEYEKLVPKDLEKLIKEQFSTLATKYGASLDKLQHYFKSADQSTQDWVKTLKDAKTEIGNQIFDAKKLDKDTTALEPQKQVIEEMITAWDNSEKTQKAGAKSAEQALKDELAAVEKIYKRYQDLRKLKSETDTQSILAKEFKGVSLTTLSKAYSPEQMLEVYEKALAEAQRLGKKDLVLEIQTKIGEFNVAEEQRKLEKSLKDLSDKISRTKTAKEFFDRMLGMTGDKQLSATLTMSVYGVTQDADLGSELGKSIAKQMQDQVQKYFGDIDISSAINKATGEIDPIGLEKLLTEENMAKIGEKDVENIRKIISDLISTDAKFWNEMMKDLEKTQTYGDKLVKVYETLQKRIEAIKSREDLDEPTKGNLIDQVKANAEKEMSKLQYEAFKDSPLYVAMFEKLDATSTTMLTNMRNHLEALKGEWKNSLDPSQLKELQKRINDIDKQLSSRNPFKGMIDGFKEFSDLRKARSRKDDESKAFDATKKRLEAEKAYEQAVAEGKPSEEIARLAKELDNCVEKENEATTNMREWDDAMQKVLQGAQELKKYTQIIQETTTAVNDIVEAFGGWGNSVDETFWNTMLDGINKFIGGVESATLGVGKIMVGDIVGGVTSLISGIGSIVSSIGNFIYADRIRNADKGIEQLQDRLDSLSYAYDRLQSAQEKAFGTDYISNYERQLENLEAQQEAYLKQADLERSKGKKADKEKIKDYEEQARNTADAIKDMYGSLSEHFLGQDLASAARDFASAWIEAYKEFSNTTDAMKSKFQDMIQNMVVESLLAKVMERALEPVFTMIDEMQAEDFYSTSFWQRVMATMQTATENGVVGAENVMSMLEQMGINLRGLGGEMTGISRDIATASEESILGLAAGINTQNFYISQVPTKLDTIIGLLRGDGAIPQGNAMTLQDVMIAQNQFLSHLPTIAQHTAETVAECKQIVAETRRTADALDRVIKPKGTQTTHTLNTTIN